MSYFQAKYPRTPHLPWSKGKSDDDLSLNHCVFLEGQEVVVTLKMDGENTSMYKESIHARSLMSKSHSTRTWVQGLHGQISHKIPFGYRLCGENMYAKHSIKYNNLPSYFLLFAVFDAGQTCLSWDDTVKWAKDLGLYTVPVLYRGVYDPDLIKALESKKYGENEMEGYIVRLARDFKYEDHRYSVAKFVRANHVNTPTHWMSAAIEKNELSKDPGMID